MASSGSSNLAGFATALLNAFGLSAPGGGETGTPASGVNTWGGIVAGGGGSGSESYPKAFVNLLVFDKNYNFLDIGWDQINGGEQVGADPKAAHDYLTQEYTAREEGYIYVYVSNENSTLVEVYFDDVVVTHTKSNLIQGNEYYPFGMQTANSWTREAVTGNNYLANGGTELNSTTQVYDLNFRNYDPVLGRMFQVDPIAPKYASFTPYNYSLNDPVNLNDPMGDDVEPENPYREYLCAMCWRDGDNLRLYEMAAGGGMTSLGDGWRPGQNGLANYLSNSEGVRYGWAPDFAGPVQYTDDLGNTRHTFPSWLEYAERQKSIPYTGSLTSPLGTWSGTVVGGRLESYTFDTEELKRFGELEMKRALENAPKLACLGCLWARGYSEVNAEDVGNALDVGFVGVDLLLGGPTGEAAILIGVRKSLWSALKYVGKALSKKLYSPATYKTFEKQLAEAGVGSLKRSMASYERKITIHLKKIEEAKRSGGYTSSMERELRIYRWSIQAIKDLLKIKG